MAHALTTYRETHELTLAEFGSRIGVPKGMIWKWENGTVPRPKFMALIREATDGAVTANDWMPPEAHEAAA